jgi:Calpain family cysteine protease.
MLLEKAYAKLNGGYDNIVAGKVHFALSDLTGGEPEEIKLETLRDNPESL